MSHELARAGDTLPIPYYIRETIFLILIAADTTYLDELDHDAFVKALVGEMEFLCPWGAEEMTQVKQYITLYAEELQRIAKAGSPR